MNNSFFAPHQFMRGLFSLFLSVFFWQYSCSALAQSSQKNTQSAPIIKQEAIGLNESMQKLLKEAEEAKRVTASRLAEEEARNKRIEESKAEMRTAVTTLKPASETLTAAQTQVQTQTSVLGVNQAQLSANPEQRLALVIGNSNYKSSPLANPANDARAMAIKLQQLGFHVIKKENADREEMMNAVRDFGNQLKNGGVGLFYYAGHGIQSKGNNYLVPVDSNINSEDELATRAYNAGEVLEKMDSAKNRINMVILDACRDNPFARSFRSGSRGLASVEQAPSGTLVAYATSPGSTASDGTGANGLYTEQLLQAMSEPGIKLEDVFKRVRVNVMDRSGGKQTPWEMSSVTGDFFFNPTAGQQAMVSLAPSSVIRQADLPRQMMPVLIPRKLVENYQLAGGFHLNAAPALMSFSDNAKWISLATKDKVISVWNAQNAVPVSNETGLATVAREAGIVMGVFDNGQISLTDLHSEDGTHKSFAISNGQPVVSAISPNARRLLVYSRNKGFVLYDLNSQQIVGKMEESVDGEPHFKFSPKGDKLLTWGSKASNMTLWDTERGVRISRLTDHWRPVGKVVFSPDGNFLLSAAFDDRVILWRTSDGDAVRKFSFADGNPLPQWMDFINDGKQVIAHVSKSLERSATQVMQLGIWDAASGNLMLNLMPEGIALNSYIFSPDKKRLFVNGADRNIYVFDLLTLKRINSMIGAQLLDFSSDGRRFLIINNEGIRLMDSQTLSPIGRMPGQISAFMPAKKTALFATGAADGAITLWNLENGDPIGQLKGHFDTVSNMIFSDDARQILSVASDHSAKLWAIPAIKDVNQLAKDTFESTVEYHKRMVNWSSPFTSLVNLQSFNADSEIFTVKFGDVSVQIPIERDAAKKLLGQKQAIISGTLKFFDIDQLVLNEAKLSRLP